MVRLLEHTHTLRNLNPEMQHMGTHAHTHNAGSVNIINNNTKPWLIMELKSVCECVWVCVFFRGRILHAHWRIQLNRSATLIYLGREVGYKKVEEER